MIGNSVLLDTSVIVRHLRDSTAIHDKLANYDEIYVPHVALGELYYGALRSIRPEASIAQIEQFLAAVNVLDSNGHTAREYGNIAAQLARQGTPIPQNDIWIAASAIQYGMPLATADSHFRRVERLNLLLW